MIAKIYQYNGSSWNQVGSDILGIQGVGDWFGRSIALNNNGNTVAVGAPYNDDNGSNAGHVRCINYLCQDVWILLL